MSIHFIPNEILVNIIHSLTSLKDVLNCRLVCRHWNNLIMKYGTKVETLYYNIARDSIKYYEGQNIIIQNKNLRRRNLKFLFGIIPNLKRLGIYGCPPRPIIYDLIGDYFIHLQGLCLSDTTLSEDNFIRLMENLPNLKVLTFSRRAKEFDKELPTIDVTQGLKVASSLKAVHLSGNFELDDAFQFHSGLEELEIDLVDEYHFFSPLNYESLLQNCVNLKRLSVYGFFPLMVVFQNSFPKLEHFEWNKKEDSHDFEPQEYIDAIRAARNFKKLPNLKTLVIKFFDDVLNCGIVDLTEDELVYATCDMQMYLVNFLPNLTNLCLDSGCDLKMLTTRCPNIERLQFNGSLSPKLEDSSCHLFGNLKKLKELRVVSRCITKDCIRIIVDACANLERLYVDGSFGWKEGRSLLAELCEKLNREIVFDKDNKCIETLWRDDWLNQFIDPVPDDCY
ncbi:uncharacterized protein LOC107365883 [Tetranychus urticae]|uniref:F-box domain-containing protein n=1 Tax=Tetranychus urticae TaxID=32264 RepID=T1KNT8_TETUR|nr:uncharacterized protein LOC107365883 [Tetranychus urticae]